MNTIKLLGKDIIGLIVAYLDNDDLDMLSTAVHISSATLKQLARQTRLRNAKPFKCNTLSFWRHLKRLVCSDTTDIISYFLFLNENIVISSEDYTILRSAASNDELFTPELLTILMFVEFFMYENIIDVLQDKLGSNAVCNMLPKNNIIQFTSVDWICRGHIEPNQLVHFISSYRLYNFVASEIVNKSLYIEIVYGFLTDITKHFDNLLWFLELSSIDEVNVILMLHDKLCQVDKALTLRRQVATLCYVDTELTARQQVGASYQLWNEVQKLCKLIGVFMNHCSDVNKIKLRQEVLFANNVYYINNLYF